MVFDSESGMLSCGSCGRKDSIENYQENPEVTPDENVRAEFAADEAKEYQCNNCGGVVITDADTTATTCCFCGAGVVLVDRLSGTLMPAKVIPFSINKEQARDAFKKWTKKGRLAPDSFKKANRIKEITGMYVPFWLYDVNSRAKVEAAATKVRTYTRGDYIYTETKHYEVYRHVNVDFTKVPADASEKMDDKIMDLLEPFDYSNLKDFKTPYLAGYLAEKYNYDDKQLFPRVKSKVSGAVDSYVSSTIKGYSSVRYRNENVNTRSVHSDYVLLPVWLVFYDYDKSEHIFAMNGQTGKIVGKPPLSKRKAVTLFTSITAATFLVSRIITMLLGGPIL